MGLKTHAKLTQVLRREQANGVSALVPYVHLGTGNYHSVTTKLYTDFGMLTTNPAICSDVEKVFMHLTSLTKVERLKHLWLAPFALHRELLKALGQEAAAAAAGKPARVIAKMNALTDESTISALYEASRAGVKIDLIVRGGCACGPASRGCRRTSASARSSEGSSSTIASTTSRTAASRASTWRAPTGWGATCSGASRSRGRCSIPSWRSA